MGARRLPLPSCRSLAGCLRTNLLDLSYPNLVSEADWNDCRKVGYSAGGFTMRASFVLPLVMMVVWSSYDPYPWCAVYGGSWSGTSNCGFKTFQQCMATVSGIGGFCEPNQFFNPRRSGTRAKAARLPYYGSDAPSYGGFSSPSYFFDD